MAEWRDDICTRLKSAKYSKIMTKDEARLLARKNIKMMSAAEREWASGAIVDAISGLDCFKDSRRSFIFLGTETEPDTEELVGLSLMLERIVSVPRVRGRDMDAILITPYSDFRKNRWGILEPAKGHTTDDVDLAVVPLVAFDGLNRVGHGGGYYDRFLSSHPCFKLGVAFDCQNIRGVDIDEFDVPLDALVTEKRILLRDKVMINPYFG